MFGGGRFGRVKRGGGEPVRRARAKVPAQATMPPGGRGAVVWTLETGAAGKTSGAGAAGTAGV